MDRAIAWWDGVEGARFNQTDKTWWIHIDQADYDTYRDWNDYRPTQR